MLNYKTGWTSAGLKMPLGSHDINGLPLEWRHSPTKGVPWCADDTADFARNRGHLMCPQ